MKKAFTFAELMISLVVISILAAILYPTVAHFTPNSNKPLFKAAYRILTTSVSTIVNAREDGELPLCKKQSAGGVVANLPTDDNSTCAAPPYNDSGYALCMAMCQIMNVLPKGNITACTGANNICATNPTNVFQTTNGMRWQFANYSTANVADPYTTGQNIQNVFLVYVDINAKNNNQTGVPNGFPVHFDTSGANLYKGIFHYTANTDVNTGIYTTAPNPAANQAAVFNLDRLKNQDTFMIAIDKKGNIVSMSPAGYANLEDVEAGKNL